MRRYLVNAHLVLSSCPDFQNEIGALEDIVRSRGHILILSPKCHPELAGCGIEYVWGKSKLNYRRFYDDLIPTHLHDNIVKSLKSITLDMVLKFERKTRDYRRVYEEIDNEIQKGESGMIKQENICYSFNENKVKEYKSHRNIVDSHCKYLNSV